VAIVDDSAGYGSVDEERWVTEPTSIGGSERSPFARDRARVLHSAALRRLAGKTQVVAPSEGDFPRTRLTHSLECAQIGRELAAALGADPDVVDAACLAHDLGHPPFGHTGEDVLNELARDDGGFEGNAQSLRILTRLEAKILTADRPPRSAGLNLTRAVLDAATKYPWPRQAGTRKFGVYEDDRSVFEWLRVGARDGRPSFEAQVMDWADDVAYSVHDVEDAIYTGRFAPRLLRDSTERAALFALASRYAPDAESAELDAALGRLQTLDYWPAVYDRSFTAQAALKHTTSQLIGRLTAAATTATRAAYPADARRRHLANVVVPRAARLECAVLKAVAARYVMDRQDARDRRFRQRELLAELVAGLMKRPDLMEPHYASAFDAADGAGRRRVVVDQVASLTDASAVALHRTVTDTRPGAVDTPSVAWSRSAHGDR
jgi:dGTPase